jgi:CMP/dCMP kinase
MIIAISGKAGSGKTTVAKTLAKELNLDHYSIGSLMRAMAKERKMSLRELGKMAEQDKSIDAELDRRQMELRSKDNFVIDGRLTAFFIPNADVKVFLECEDKVRAERILKDERKEESSKAINEAISKIIEREKSEARRYKKYYNVDYSDRKLYNLFIDTTKLSVKEAVDKIMSAVSQRD